MNILDHLRPERKFYRVKASETSGGTPLIVDYNCWWGNIQAIKKGKDLAFELCGKWKEGSFNTRVVYLSIYKVTRKSGEEEEVRIYPTGSIKE